MSVKKYLEDEFGYGIETPEFPQLTGAIGAALIGQENNSN